MKYIKSYKLFESYLKGGRQPLYHITRYLEDILKDDILKVSSTADHENAICFTRSSTYNGDNTIDYRLVLDDDKLRKDGYNIVPYDEQMNYVKNALGKGYHKDKRVKGKSKVNYKWRPPKHKLDIPKVEDEYGEFNLEYEERLYKDIGELGKYLIAIDISVDIDKKMEYMLVDYIKKYPNIKVINISQDKPWYREEEYDLTKHLIPSKRKLVSQKTT